MTSIHDNHARRPQNTTLAQSHRYEIVLAPASRTAFAEYLKQLQTKQHKAGAYLQQQLTKAGITDLQSLDTDAIIYHLLSTKKPQIFAEMSVYGDGSDWNLAELALLGDVGVACKVRIFDDGQHHKPVVHSTPFEGYLLVTPGALLRNGRNQIAADWHIVDQSGQIDPDRHYALYERRLLPLLQYANHTSRQLGKQAIITIPGIGCGQFAGKFIGQLGEKLEQVLLRLLRTYRDQLDAIAWVHFDPYQECSTKTYDIDSLTFAVNPLTKASKKLNQLCPPARYLDTSDQDKLMLFSFVAWDHVSWPGNDFYLGARATDDGVKAAATDSMYAITGIPGHYDPATHCYLPPAPFKTWLDVIKAKGLSFP